MRIIRTILLVLLFTVPVFAQGGFNFPDNPTLNQIVTGPGGQQFKWDGTKWIAIGGSATLFAPITNPSGGQNNYAPLASPNFTGTVSIGGQPITTLFGPALNTTCNAGQAVTAIIGSTVTCVANWLPVYNPTFTGLMTGPAEFLTTMYTPALSFGNTMARPYANIAVQSNIIAMGAGSHYNGTTQVADTTGAASIGIESTPDPIISFNAASGLTVGGVAILSSNLSISPKVNPNLRYEGVVSINAWVPNTNTAGLQGANVLQMSSWGNWPASVTLANRIPGPNASETYYLNNDANEYGSVQLTNTGFTLDGTIAAPNSMILGTSAANGMVFNNAVGIGFDFWAPVAASQGGGSINLFGVGTQGGYGGQAVGSWMSQPLGGPGSYSAYYAGNNVDDYIVMQIQSSDNVYQGPPRSAFLQTSGASLSLNSLGGPLSSYSNGDISFQVQEWPVGNFTRSGSMVGLQLGGFAARFNSNAGYTSLSIGNGYIGSYTFSNMNFSGASYYVPGPGWVADGGAGGGASLVQVDNTCVNMYNAGSMLGGQGVPWNLIGQWCGSGEAAGHISNLTTERIPTVSSGTLMKGSRDTFGWIENVKGGQTTISFAEEYQYESNCTLTDSGEPNLWFEANQTSKQVTFVCVVPWTGEQCADGAWVEYHCFGQGNETQLDHIPADIRKRSYGSVGTVTKR